MSRIETGEQRTRLMPAAFRSDPRRPAVEALETFNPVTQTAAKKAVFSRRTAMPHRMELGADTPQEALDLVLIHRRRVDLGEIARLLGTDEADARAQLGTLVFDDPATGNLVAAGEYLSGNVREKLAAARTAAAGDPDRYTANVDSLQAVQPPALAAEDIQARLGSAWLSREIVQEGLRHVLQDPRLTVIHPGGSEWKVESRTARNSRAQDTYGTSDWNALDLAGALLTNASITVRRTTIDPVTGAEKSYRDDAATLFAFRKAQRLDADFVSWLWSDPRARGRMRAPVQQRLQQPGQTHLGLLPLLHPGPGARHEAAPVPERHGAPPAHRERPGRVGGGSGQDRTRHRRGDGRRPAGPAPADRDRDPGQPGQPVARPDLPHLPRSQGAGRRRRPARPQGRPGSIHRARRLGRLPAGHHPVRVLRVPPAVRRRGPRVGR